MKIGFARFENGSPYATINPGQDTLEAYEADLAHCNPGKEFALGFFSEAPPPQATYAATTLAALDALVQTSDNLREGLEWLFGRIYNMGIEQGRAQILSSPAAERARTQLDSMGFKPHS